MKQISLVALAVLLGGCGGGSDYRAYERAVGMEGPSRSTTGPGLERTSPTNPDPPARTPDDFHPVDEVSVDGEQGPNPNNPDPGNPDPSNPGPGPGVGECTCQNVCEGEAECLSVCNELPPACLSCICENLSFEGCESVCI